MKERPTALDGRRRRRVWQSIPQRAPQVRQRPIDAQLTRGFVEGGALEQQADSDVPAKGHGDVACRYAVGPFFDLPDDAGPSSQREQLGAQVIGDFFSGDSQLSQ
jgi:hypothetical protein